MNRHLLKLTVFVATSLFISYRSFGCSYSIPTYEVQPSFSVRVKSDQRSFAGVRVVLQRTENKPYYKTTVLYSAKTNDRGVAVFEAIDSGVYLVSVDQLGGAGFDSVYVHVSSDYALSNIDLQWPSGKFIEMSRVSGTLISAPTGKPLADISLSLVDGLAGTRVSSAITDDSGQFDLGAPVNGFYFLKVYSGLSGDRELTGDVPVIVGSAGKANISLAAEETTCGLSYGEVCRVPKIVTGRLRGSVGDKLNPGFPAKIVLSRLKKDGGRTDKSVEADQTGSFDFSGVPSGDYELQINYYFQSPVIVPVTVDLSSHNDAPLRIDMASLNHTCDDAKVEVKPN